MGATTSDDTGRRADALAAAGDVAGAVRVLVAAGHVERAAQVVDDALDELGARFQHAAVRAAVGTLPPAARSLPARLALADTELFRGETLTGALQDLLAEATAADDPELTALATALLAEHLLVHADPSGVFLAAEQLSRLPSEPLQRPRLLVARARLRRVVLAARILLAPAETVESEAELVACVDDYRRAGRHTDRWLTVALCRALRAAGTWAAVPGDRQTVVEARDQLLAMGSPQAAWARWAAALLATVDADPAAVRAELAALLRDDPDVPAFPLVMTTQLDAVCALEDAAAAADPDQARAAAVRRLEDVAGTVRRDYPLFSGSVLAITAHALLDAGLDREAAQWLGRLGAYPAFMPHEEHERELLRCRVALAAAARDGSLDAAAGPQGTVTGRVTTALDGLVAQGAVRMAGALALRTALTARAAGADDLADALVTRATGLLPADGRTGQQDRWLAAAQRATTGGAGVHRLRLLTPSAEVVVDGEPCRPAPAVVRILGVLAAAGRPLATEQLADLLWPDADPVAARGRLKSAHHRLRGTLGPAADGLVRRDGDVWTLAPAAGWSVDLADFRRLAAGGPADRAAAVRLPTGFLWDTQFAYDEALAELREPLRATWLGLARRAVADGVLPASEFDELRRRLGVEAG